MFRRAANSSVPSLAMRCAGPSSRPVAQPGLARPGPAQPSPDQTRCISEQEIHIKVPLRASLLALRPGAASLGCGRRRAPSVEIKRNDPKPNKNQILKGGI